MSQSWTENSFASTNVAQTDLQNMENNFITLKTMFSGSTAPTSPSSWQPWGDSTNHILKIRNEANNAWIDVFDMTTQAVIKCKQSVIAGNGLSGGGQLTTSVTINHAAHTGDVTGSSALTISTDVVDPSNCYPGTLQVIADSVSTSITWKTVAWTDLANYKIKCPSGPTLLRFYAKANRGAAECSIRFLVDGVSTGSNATIATASSWFDLGTADMSSATPGSLYDVKIQGTNDSSNTNPRIESVSAWWE